MLLSRAAWGGSGPVGACSHRGDGGLKSPARLIGKSHRRELSIGAGVIVVALCAAMVFASGSTANRVLGQLDFTHSTPNLVDAKGLSNPGAVAIDTSGTPNRIYFADAVNDRVLGWKDAAAFTNGAPADLVIGQPDFLSSVCSPAIPGSFCFCSETTASSLCTPSGVAVDGAGNLYVSDNLRSRVLEYSSPFNACNNTFPCIGGPANLVFGQGGSFTSTGCNIDSGGTTPTNADLCEPTGLAVDKSENLYVADSGNDRVLKYDTPLSTDTVADMVFGQGEASPPATAISIRAEEFRPPLTCAIQLDSCWMAPAISSSRTASTTGCWNTMRR